MMKHPFRIAGLAAWIALFAFPGQARTNDSYHQAAMGAAHWMEANSLGTPHGLVWASDPQDPKTVNTTLYAGTPGPILFFLEAYRYTHDQAFLEEGRRGADALLASISKKDETGLYEGFAGSGFTLGEAYLITGDVRYRQGALQCVRWLEERAERTPDGVKWNDVTDIIAGSSGTGLFLLWAAEHLRAPGSCGRWIRPSPGKCQTSHTAPLAFPISWPLCIGSPVKRNFSMRRSPEQITSCPSPISTAATA